jgi:CRP/FNR family cyclic AMP-dependent transcriptional regulator
VTVNNSGKSLVVAEMEPGNFFGEMSMLAGEPRSATVTAVVDSMVFELQRESFSQVLNAREGLAESISQLVVERQMSNNEKLQDASRAELDEAISGASINLRDRIRAVFSLFRAEL